MATQLPHELWIHILSESLQDRPLLLNGRRDDSSTAEDARERRQLILQLMHVCREWKIIAEDLLYADLDLDGAQLPALISRIRSGAPVPMTRRIFLHLHYSRDSVALATEFIALRPGLQAFLTYNPCASALANITQVHTASGHTLSHLQVWLDMKALETAQIVRLLPEFPQLRTLSITVCNGDTRQGRNVLAETPEIMHHGVTALTYFSYGASRAPSFGLLERLSLPALAHVRLKVANAKYAPTPASEFASLGQFFTRHGSLAELRLSLETVVDLNELLALPMSPRTLVLETAAETELRARSRGRSRPSCSMTSAKSSWSHSSTCLAETRACSGTSNWPGPT